MEAGELFVTIRPDTAGFESELAGAVGEAEPVEIPVEADPSDAEAAIAEVEGEVEPIEVPIEADSSDAEAALSDLSGAAESTGGAAEEAAGGMDAASLAAAGLAGQSTSARGALASLTGGASAATVGVGALAAGLGFAVSEAADAEQVLAITNQIISNMGEGSGVTSAGVQELATRIQEYSGFSDEAVISGAGLIATFQNVRNQAGEGNDIFDRTLTISADLARRLGTDVPQAAQQLGRALTSPETGLSRLERQIGKFPAAQHDMIVSLAQSGDLLGAQRALLDALESRVGGVAEAYGQTLAGQLDIAKQAISEAAEAVGAVLIPVISDVVPIATTAANALGDLTGGVQSLGDAIGGLPGGGLITTMVNPLGALGQAADVADDGVSGLGAGLDELMGIIVHTQAVADLYAILESLGVDPGQNVSNVADAVNDLATDADRAATATEALDAAWAGLNTRLSAFDAVTAAGQANQALADSFAAAREDASITGDEFLGLRDDLSGVVQAQQELAVAQNTGRNGTVDYIAANQQLRQNLAGIRAFIPAELLPQFDALTNRMSIADTTARQIPDKVRVNTSAPGSDQAITDLEAVQKKAQIVDAMNVTIDVGVNVGTAIAQIAELERRTNALGESSALPGEDVVFGTGSPPAAPVGVVEVHFHGPVLGSPEEFARQITPKIAEEIGYYERGAQMACQVGKIGCSSAKGGDGLVLMSPNVIRRDGDSLAVGGEFVVSDTVGRVLADQVSGYGPHNPDEDVIPFIYDAVSVGGALDGFYAILGTKVDYDKLASGKFSWSADLVKVAGWQTPAFEITSKGEDRATASGADGEPWVTYPKGDVTGSIPGDTTVAVVELETATGLLQLSWGASDYFYDGYLIYDVEPASYYDAACGIEVTWDAGVNWWSLIGRQIPNDADGWRLTNGVVRATNVAGTIRVEQYDTVSNVWETTDFVIGITSGGSAGFSQDVYWRSVTVLRNRPESAAIRLTGGGGFSTILDLGVRRGGTLIEGRFTYSDAAQKPAVFRSASEAGTAITAGIEATAADANGNKYVILSPDAVTKDVTGQSGIELTAAGSYIDFAVGVSNADLTAGLSVTEQYFAAHKFRQRITAR